MQAVSRELGRHSAPGEAQSGADHRQHGGRLAHEAYQVRQQRQCPQSDEHERDGLVAGLRFAAFGRPQRSADDTDHDRRDGDPLAPARLLAEHALAKEQQHEQSGGKGWLHHHQRCEQQRDHLKRPAEDRQPRSEQPARAHHEIAREAQAQVNVMGCALGVDCLQRHP